WRPPSPRSPLFPYTTLFRSRSARNIRRSGRSAGISSIIIGENYRHRRIVLHGYLLYAGRKIATCVRCFPDSCDKTVTTIIQLCRSEEHTSELQSRENLVCRL